MIITKEMSQDLDAVSDYLLKNDFVGTSILVTGATGLIGSLIIRSIDRFNQKNESKIRAFALVRNREKAKDIFGDQLNCVDFIYQDVCDEICEKIIPDYVIHTASPTTSRYLVEKPVESIQSICTGTMRVLRFARKVHAKGVVNLSSMETFGQVYSSEKRLSENELGYVDLTNVRNCYAESKRLCELLCKCYSDEYGLRVMSARLAQVFGPGIASTENRVFAQFARSAVNEENIVLHTTGESMGNYCYTVDAIKAILLLLKKGQAGETYTVVNEASSMMIKDMANLVLETLAQGDSKVVFDIPDTNHFGYADTTKMRLSAKKIRELGWEPTVSLRDTYIRMRSSL